MALSIWTAIGMHSPTVLDLNNFWKSHRPDSWKDYPLAGRSESSKPPMKYFRPWRFLPFIFCIACGLVGIMTLLYPNLLAPK
jgi:hypothetical protein